MRRRQRCGSRGRGAGEGAEDVQRTSSSGDVKRLAPSGEPLAAHPEVDISVYIEVRYIVIHKEGNLVAELLNGCTQTHAST